MKDGANLSQVILMAFPLLFGILIGLDVVLLLIALFTGGWWLFVLGCLATGALAGWRWYQLRKIGSETI